VTVDVDKQMVVFLRNDQALDEVDVPDVELLQQNRRAYTARVEARIELRRRELLAAAGVPHELFPTLRLLKDPVRCQEILDLLRRVDIDALEQASVAIWDEEHGRALRVCSLCNAVMQSEDPTFPASHYGGRACGACEQRRLTVPSDPPQNGLRSALARARRAHLPATLTAPEWQATVEHFTDRCALCGGAWCLVEHATPIELGGGTTAANCLPACTSCNIRKGKRVLESIGMRVFDDVRLEAAATWLRSCGRVS
jgi:hypothetical protein